MRGLGVRLFVVNGCCRGLRAQGKLVASLRDLAAALVLVVVLLLLLSRKTRIVSGVLCSL